MATLQFSDVELTDDGAWKAWYDVYFAAFTHEREFHTAFASEPLRALLTGEDPGFRYRPVIASIDGAVVGIGNLVLPMLDNPRFAKLHLGVAPERRRQGIGTVLLAHMEQLAREESRSLMVTEIEHPYDVAADDPGHPGLAFARHHGFAHGLGNLQRVLDLPVADDLLDRLEEQAAAKHAGYTFRDVTGTLPDDLVLPLGRIRAAVEVEAPMGEIQREAPHVDEERVRAEERIMVAMGRQAYATLAFAPDGEPAGYTEVAVSSHEPEWVYQWGTLVYREHRGHALGLATKVRNTRWVQGLRPGTRGIRTWNAEENAPMIAVNELLGYRPVERLSEWQKQLG